MLFLTCGRPSRVAGHNSGYPVYPVLATQGMVSCGSTRMSDDCIFKGVNGERNRPYTGGCGGAQSYPSMLYLRDHGLTWASCYPYEFTGDGVSGGTGNSNVKLKDVPSCRTTCANSFTAQYPNVPMTFFKGVAPRSIMGEEQMKQAIMDGGPIMCGMDTYNSFGDYKDTFAIYTVELGRRDGPNLLNKDGGRHAVVIYGWGTELGDEWDLSDVRASTPAYLPTLCCPSACCSAIAPCQVPPRAEAAALALNSPPPPAG